MSKRSTLATAICAFALIAAGGVSAQNFPTKPVRIITSSPGGSSDTQSRIIGTAMAETIGQPVIVDNRGNFGGENLAKAAPDGHTVMLDGFSLYLGTLFQKLTYDPLTFVPITIALNVPNVIVVNPSVPAKTIKELIALAKAKPGALNYGSGGMGGTAHLGAELFKVMAGVDIVNVNYAGTGPALNATIAGEVQMMVANATIATPQIKAGKLRALGVGSLQPSPLVPYLPTVATSGLPGYESNSPVVIVAPAKTPAPLVNRLNEEIVRVLQRPDIKERFLTIGVETMGTSPSQAASYVAAEMAKWSKVVKDAGIRAN